MPAHRVPGATPDAVREALSSPLGGLGLLLEDVTVTPAGRRRVLRVVVDAVDVEAPSLSLDEVAEASRTVSEVLDSSDVMGEQPYVLEVSTPGVDRDLVEPRHFARNVGRLVRVSLRGGEPAGDGSVEGRIQSAGDSLVLLVPGPAKGTTSPRVVEWSSVLRGRVQVEFNRSDEGS